MGFLCCRSPPSNPRLFVLIVLICLQVLFLLPHNSSALRSRDFLLGRHQDRDLLTVFASLSQPDTISEEVGLAPVPSAMTFDPNQSEKRRVPRGSDPIHNKC
ncbi:hypothetical protein MLD38_012519 [Melastoma candidum]|uniref:Uncharacterized protein n=1 Tax=Melastoma candidum TaxID=119954 RepID=A0ACB9R611_9MYRT|nr:hypothetical protein MLD38_012519 [Melastoma candidum]